MSVLDSLPLLFVNLSGEMMYILDQRLSAQRIEEAKSSKVRYELLNTLFSPNFLDGLFKTQPLYDMESLKMLFQKLVHSSILRLNQDSMDRLFDLMVMAVKYQLLACSRSSDVVLMTLNHFDGIRQINQSEDIQLLLERAFDTIVVKYADYSSWRLQRIRQNMVNFLQDWRVRVSVFLREGIQHQDGYFNLQFTGRVPDGFSLPGVSTFLLPHASTEFDTPIQFQAADDSVVCLDFIGNRGTDLGCNIESFPRSQEKPPNCPNTSVNVMNAGWQLLSQLLQTDYPSSDAITLNWLNWSGDEDLATFRDPEEPERELTKSTLVQANVVRNVPLNLMELKESSCVKDSGTVGESLLDLLDQAL